VFSGYPTNHAIRWLVIFPVDIVISTFRPGNSGLNLILVESWLRVVLGVDVGVAKGPSKRGHIVADTLLPTQMFPRLPARATFVADTKNVSDFVQKHFVSAANVSQETS